MVVIAVVSGVVGQVMLDAGARGARVAAAEGNAFHQVFAFHVALDTAKKFHKKKIENSLALIGPYSLVWHLRFQK